MKNILFAHDGPLYVGGDMNYYGVDYNTELKNRYLYLASKLTFLTRVKEHNNVNQLSKIDGVDFRVAAVPDFKQLKNFYKNYRSGKKLIESEVMKSDILIIRLPSIIGNITYHYAIKYNKPFIIELVACPWDGYFNHSFMGKIIAPFMYITTKHIVKYSDYVIYVSEKFLQQKYPTNGKSLSCSDVTLPKIKKSYLENRIEKYKREEDNKRIIIGTVGAVNMKYKGQKYVIQAIKSLIQKGYNIEYKLVGGGDNSYLKKIAEKESVTEYVKFLGSMPHESVIEFMSEIDIYIQPSNVESHGRVIIEAFSTACPVIGSSTGGIPELVNSEYVFKKKNKMELEEKIVKLISSDQIEIFNNNFNKAIEFSIDKLNSKRKKFYNQILDEIGESDYD